MNVGKRVEAIQLYREMEKEQERMRERQKLLYTGSVDSAAKHIPKHHKIYTGNSPRRELAEKLYKGNTPSVPTPPPRIVKGYDFARLSNSDPLSLRKRNKTSFTAGMQTPQ